MSRADKDWKGRRLFVLLYIFAKCGEAFIRDLGQSDTIDSLDRKQVCLLISSKLGWSSGHLFSYWST